MATSVNEIIARARTIATGMGGDPNVSAVIDNKPALRALLNSVLNTVYSNRAADKKNWRDVAVRHAVTITAGVGTLPAGVMREFLRQADFANSDGDLISYIEQDIDDNHTFSSQLGYVKMRGDDLLFIPPNGTATSYTGTLNMTAVSTPAIPASAATTFSMTSDITDEVCYMLALALRGEAVLT